MWKNCFNVVEFNCFIAVTVKYQKIIFYSWVTQGRPWNVWWCIRVLQQREMSFYFDRKFCKWAWVNRISSTCLNMDEFERLIIPHFLPPACFVRSQNIVSWKLPIFQGFFNPQRLVSTKRSHIIKQTCSFQQQVCLSVYDLLVKSRR